MGEVMKFQLETYHRNVSNEDLIHDVRQVAKKSGRHTVTIAEYEQLGKYHPSTLQRRFRSWFNVLEVAGLKESRSRLNISDAELFDNIKDVWIALERQPKYDEFKTPLSKYSAGTYENRFGSWRKALEAFVNYIDSDNPQKTLSKDSIQSKSLETTGNSAKKKTKRDISERLRFAILLRDGFRCQSCGKSPLKSPGIELHIDHIIPWSQGGETVAENLQTKCKKCNLGKGNAFNK
jgi:hypothetical protein